MPMRVVRFGRTLAGRVLFFLTVALVPIGLIAVYQTRVVVSEAASLSERDVLARTADVANAEHSLIQYGFGAANALGAVAREVGFASDACNRAMSRFIQSDSRFVFAGAIQPNGMMACSNMGTPVNFGGTEEWDSFLAAPDDSVEVNLNGTATGRSVMIVSEPVFSAERVLLGLVSVSIPHSLADTLLSSGIEGLDTALLNADGDVLTTSLGIHAAETFSAYGIIPKFLDIPAMGKALYVEDADGEPVTLAVVELIQGELYILGTWSDATNPEAVSFLGTAAPAFPVLMWIASLIVAFLAVNGLVLSPLSRLRRRMSRFSLEAREKNFVRVDDAPLELQEIAGSYNRMVDHVLADHRELEDALAEKEVLLKEVHHRVKNNLQLIASILNMQLRTIEAPEARLVLRQVQDRVMSLATIHKSLYTDTQVDVVRADTLLHEIIGQVLNVGIAGDVTLKTEIALAHVELDPDQAVPLSLLVTEAVTNAVKYSGADEGSDPWLTVTLSEETGGRVTLIVANSLGIRKSAPDDASISTRLGSRLISAFVSQLGGELSVEEADDRYEITARFVKLGAEAETAEAAEAAEAAE